MLQPGSQITIQANSVIGVPAVAGVVISNQEFGYVVHVASETPSESFPVDFDGNILTFE